jgi:hypothetical protein
MGETHFIIDNNYQYQLGAVWLPKGQAGLRGDYFVPL